MQFQRNFQLSMAILAHSSKHIVLRFFYSKVEYEGNLREISINRDIWKVIYEETAAYFAGDKSAREMAYIVQSWIQLMLDK